MIEVFSALNRSGFSDLAVAHQRAWLRRVAHNRAIDLLRKMARLMFTSLDKATEYASSDLTPEEHNVRGGGSHPSAP